jgi:hypothetical protein
MEIIGIFIGINKRIGERIFVLCEASGDVTPLWARFTDMVEGEGSQLA